MPSFEEHCLQSEKLFGDRFEEVHRWLDAFAGTPEYGFRHRKKRHHEEGIREAVKLFGASAAAAARQHIIEDLRKEGWNDTYPFPKNERDYVAMGLF